MEHYITFKVGDFITCNFTKYMGISVRDAQKLMSGNILKILDIKKQDTTHITLHVETTQSYWVLPKSCITLHSTTDTNFTGWI